MREGWGTGWLFFAACYVFAAIVFTLWAGRMFHRHDAEYRPVDELAVPAAVTQWNRFVRLVAMTAVAALLSISVLGFLALIAVRSGVLGS